MELEEALHSRTQMDEHRKVGGGHRCGLSCFVAEVTSIHGYVILLFLLYSGRASGNA